jgi:lipopolysaccharide/colanic/teichoic acid biosynthesis glycosyltransferase
VKRRLVLIMDREEPAIIAAARSSRTYDLIASAGRSPSEDGTLPHIVGTEALVRTIRTGGVDDILLVRTDYGQDELQEIFEMARIYGVGYRYVTNRFEAEKSNTELSFVDSIPVVEIRSIGLRPWSRVMKRLFDIGASALGLILLSPLFAVVAIMIKIEDPAGPVIYRNRRTGKNGEEFDLYKFRYMRWEYCVKDAYGVKREEDAALAYERSLIARQSHRAGPIYKIKDDPRKTRVGAFIERYSIDELPQLANVLIGNMSLVGPRPHQPREVELYDEPSRRVLTFKPGIT